MMDGWMRPVSVRSKESGSVLVPRPWVGASVSPSLLRARVDSRPTHFKEFFYLKKGNKVENIFPLTVSLLLLQAGTTE